MAVNINTRRLPLVREAHALGEIAAAQRGGRMAKTDSVRTVVTGLIALALIALCAALMLQRIDVPNALWGFLGSVVAFYFLDPRTLAASIVQAVREGLIGTTANTDGGTTVITATSTPGATPGVPAGVSNGHP